MDDKEEEIKKELEACKAELEKLFKKYNCFLSSSGIIEDLFLQSNKANVILDLD